MSSEKLIRVIATHQYVSRFFREESDPVSLAFGRAFDQATAQFSYYNGFTWSRRKLIFKALRHFMYIFDRELRGMGIKIGRDVRDRVASRALKCLNAFTRSDAFGLWRDKTHIILIDDVVGIYAQPDFVDNYREIIYELKTFRPDKVDEYLEKQVRVFQLAYPNYEAVVLGFPWREGEYIDIHRVEFKPIRRVDAFKLLRDLKDFTLRHGREADLEELLFEYPAIRYTLHEDGYEVDYPEEEDEEEYYWL